MKYFFLILLFLICLNSCARKGPKKDRLQENFYSVDAIDGNVLTLSSGIQAELIGVDDSPEVESYLKTILDSKVSISYDSKKTPRKISNRSKVYAYVNSEEGYCLNSVLLQQKISPLRRDFLTDSLYSFQLYAQGGTPPKPGNTGDYSPETPRTTGFSVDRLRAAAFLVKTYDKRGNGMAQGSGFFIGSNGVGVSNHHVFAGGDRWTITSCVDNKTYEVSEVYGMNENLDYVVFKVDARNKKFQWLKQAKSPPKQGEEITVYGNPSGLDCTLSKGVVSALRKIETKNDLIQIDAAISPGSSGSPVVNTQGEVVGIATMKQLDCENCNFAMNIKVIKNDIPRNIQYK